MSKQYEQEKSKNRKEDAASIYFHDADAANSTRINSNKYGRFPIISKNILIVGTIIIAIAGIGFKVANKDIGDLEGEWVRQPDDTNFAGMIVEIKENGGEYIGVIKSTPVDSFKVGDIKWSDMTMVGFNTFYEYDLADDGVTRYHSKIKISFDGKTLTDDAIDQSRISYGKNQVWKKMEK